MHAPSRRSRAETGDSEHCGTLRTLASAGRSTPQHSWSALSLQFFFGEAVLMMELPRRHSTPLEGGRFAPIKSSNYGGRPLTGPRPDDLAVLRLVEWPGWVNE